MDALLYFKSIDQNGNFQETCDEYVSVQTPDGQDHVNRWHTHGPSFLNSSQYNDLNNRVFEQVKTKLENKKLPIYIGNTGYIHISEHNNSYENGWCLDDINRLVFIFNNKLYFQRYETGGPIMCRSLTHDLGFESLTEEEKNDLICEMS
jgi:hypothetical protein